MKNGHRRLALMAAALLLLCGCVVGTRTAQPVEPTLQEQLEELLAEDELCAVAYAGYDSADELLPYIETWLDGVSPGNVLLLSRGGMAGDSEAGRIGSALPE